ncbi:indole-3-glycerol phosphate synthase TrpC [Virgibacillus sp. C22-A2]|uniref:Indole-3-glycerol phosphate synthase n=1 Tax=Virgibacillus tibetensis TaxID=3042313 RepID=A0ABU6KHL4_9BACI|nr:indole-3-glycerol phosphate synthase TrpC [Virgibacillus sp. C22-A2]
MSILDKILVQKKKEVTNLLNQTFEQPDDREYRSFKKRVAASNKMSVISEIKRSSPSKGAIDMDVDPVKQAKQYEALGAAAISVLTDEVFFNGSMEDLKAVRAAVDLPILCKDFIIDPVQIDQAKEAGATIILLIVAALTQEQLRSLYNYAIEADLEVLCEVHNAQEMTAAVNLDAELIGINNRNLKTFDVDLQTTEDLTSMVTNPQAIIISESGIKTQSDVVRVRNAGSNAILVGETLMRSEDLAATFRELQIPIPVKGVE